MAGVINTTYSFVANDLITSTKLNNIADQSSFTTDAYDGTSITVTGAGKLKVAPLGITAAELASDAVTTAKILDGQVTAAKLATGAAIPSGAVMPFAMNSVPSGWLAANGDAVNRTTYAALFAAISTVYGVGDGSTTFNLPDLRGYFVRGSGTNTDGTVSGTFGAKQADAFEAHTHTFPIRDDSGGASNPYVEATSVSTIIATFTTSSTGGTETRPSNIAMLYCIKI